MRVQAVQIEHTDAAGAHGGQPFGIGQQAALDARAGKALHAVASAAEDEQALGPAARRTLAQHIEGQGFALAAQQRVGVAFDIEG